MKEGCTWLSTRFITSCLQILPFANLNGSWGKIHVSVYLNHHSLQRRKRVGGRRGKGGEAGEKKHFSCCLSMFQIQDSLTYWHVIHTSDLIPWKYFAQTWWCYGYFPPPPLINSAIGWFSSPSLSHFLFCCFKLFSLQLTLATSPSRESLKSLSSAAVSLQELGITVTLARVWI